MNSEELTYKTAITELEEIVRDIESGEIDVDVLAEKVRRSKELIKFCRDRLKGTQDEVSKLLVDFDAVDNGTDED